MTDAGRWVLIDRGEDANLVAVVAAVAAEFGCRSRLGQRLRRGFGPDWALLADTPVDEPLVVWAH